MPETHEGITEPSNQSDAADEGILDLLEGLTPSQFAQVLARLPETDGHIPEGVAHKQRAFELVKYMRSTGGAGIPQLAAVVKEVQAFPRIRPASERKNNPQSKWARTLFLVAGLSLPALLGFLYVSAITQQQNDPTKKGDSVPQVAVADTEAVKDFVKATETEVGRFKSHFKEFTDYIDTGYLRSALDEESFGPWRRGTQKSLEQVASFGKPHPKPTVTPRQCADLESSLISSERRRTRSPINTTK